MAQASRMIIFFLFFFSFGYSSFSAPKGRKTGVTFDQALPEDISNENFPDQIDSFDFPNASLLDLVKAISKLTGINFIVEPELQSKKISIIAPSPITVAEAYKAFLSALAAEGYTVIKSGAFWKIESTQKAHKDNTEVYSGKYFPNTDQLITRIIKLKYLKASEFSKTIKWLLSQDNKMSTLESSNSIILSDYGSVIERIMKIVSEMDVPGSEERIEVIPIEHTPVEELAGILSELLSIETASSRSSYISRSSRKARVSLSSRAKKESLGGNLKISSIIPNLRTKSIVVKANKEGMKKIYKLVHKLDIPIDASRTGGFYVYNVLYGTAKEIYNTLMGISPSDSKNNIKSSNIFSSSPRRTISPYTTRNSPSPLFENVRIMPNSSTNSLIIRAKNKYDYERVAAVLKKIDVPRDQVFIQAIIIEMIVNKEDNKEINLIGALGGILKNSLGSNYYFNEIFGSSVAGFLNRTFDINSLQKAQLGPGLILGLPFLKLLENTFSSKNGNTDFSSFDLGDTLSAIPQFESLPDATKSEVLRSAVQSYIDSPVNQALQTSFFPLIRLLKTAANVNVLSTPQLTTLDNVSAFIEVGENAPVGLTNTATAGVLSQNSVERKDITLKLDITPRINPESGTVQMDIKQKFDDFSNRSSSASELASRGVHIIKRNIETKMVLHDGETAVLGGLLTDKETRIENKVPLLGDIPILGWLFKGSDTTKEKRNLLVFITPTIIRGEKQREKTKEILGKKLEERIHFIKKYTRGRDPHGETLKELIPKSKAILDNQKNQKKNTRWLWKKQSPAEKSFSDQKPQEISETEESDSKTAPVEIDYPEIAGPKDLSGEGQESFFESGNEEEEFRPEDHKLAVPENTPVDSESLEPVEETQDEDENTNSEEILNDGEKETFAPVIPPEDHKLTVPEVEPIDSKSLGQKNKKKDENGSSNSKETGNDEEEGFIPITPENLGL